MENIQDDLFQDDEYFFTDGVGYEDVSDLMVSENTDPDGSYTGVVSSNHAETPVQDADDL